MLPKANQAERRRRFTATYKPWVLEEAEKCPTTRRRQRIIAPGRIVLGAVYGELYCKFGITSYKLLPANRFEEAMKFLSHWHQELIGDSPF